MQSSSSVIKNTKIAEFGNIEIITEKEAVPNDSVECLQEELKRTGNTEYDAIDRIGAFIIDNARRTAEEIKGKAISESEQIEKEAYKKGLEEGRQAGYEEAYNETVVKGKSEIENLKSLTEQNGSNFMRNVKHKYGEYLMEKEKEIKLLALSIAKQILKKQIVCDDAINQMVFDAIKACKNNKMVIIKCSKLHYDSLMDSLELWKKQIPIKGDLIVIEDSFLDDESAVIEKDNGKIEVSINVGLENIKEELLNN
jgi:flagellar assembly protein FliH